MPDGLPFGFHDDENIGAGEHCGIWEKPGSVPEFQMEILPDRKF
jgi:hypothetical protein